MEREYIARHTDIPEVIWPAKAEQDLFVSLLIRTSTFEIII